MTDQHSNRDLQYLGEPPQHLREPSPQRPGIALRFERGTLVVDGLRHGGAPPALEAAGLVWDRRIAAYRAPAHRYRQLHRLLPSVSTPGGVRDDIARRARVTPSLPPLQQPPLRRYQSDALTGWELSHRRGLVVLPTGAGKTRVALAAIARMRRPALVLVPTRVLLAQWAHRLREVLGPAVEIGIFGDGTRHLGPVTIATFASAYRHVDDFGDRFELLVVDEAHHFGSGLQSEALEMCTAGARLGLTATPPESAQAEARLEQLIGPVVCRVSIAELSGSHLSPYECTRLYVGLTPAERLAYDRAQHAFSTVYRLFRRGGGESWSEFVELAATTSPGRAALQGYIESRSIVSVARAKIEMAERLLARHRADRCLVFTADNAAAYAVSRRLLIPAITCHIGRVERAEVLAALRDGAIRAVVSARVLNEGIDLPDARVGIIIGAARGKREHVQRVGRLLRPRAGKRAVVYDVVVRATHEVRRARQRQLALVG